MKVGYSTEFFHGQLHAGKKLKLSAEEGSLNGKTRETGVNLWTKLNDWRFEFGKNGQK